MEMSFRYLSSQPVGHPARQSAQFFSVFTLIARASWPILHQGELPDTADVSGTSTQSVMLPVKSSQSVMLPVKSSPLVVSA